MEKLQYTKICPKCGSIDFPIVTQFVQILAPTPEKCKKCRYSGLFPEIDINKIESFRKEIRKYNNNSTSTKNKNN